MLTVFKKTGQDQPRQRWRCAERDRGAVRVLPLGKIQAYARRLSQHALRRLIECDAGLRQQYAARRTLKQLCAQVGFKLTQLPGQRGLCNGNCGRSSSQATGIGDGHKITQGTQVHGQIFSRSSSEFDSEMIWQMTNSVLDSNVADF